MKKMKFLGLILCFGAFDLIAGGLPQPYDSVKVLPEYDFGYYSNNSQIEEIFKNNDIRTVVEVGSWVGGGSTRHVANLLKPKQGIMYAVDTWLGSIEHQAGQSHWQPVLTYVYEQFLSNMIHWKLTDVVIPYRMKSSEAARELDVNPDLIYIDGDHTTEAVYEDLTLWYPHVKGHGILCGDDWSWETVRIAVAKFAMENNLSVEVSGNFWRFHEITDLAFNANKEEKLIQHLKNSIALAAVGASKLPKPILDIHGMSSPKVRHFLNNLCSLPNTNYLEIGIWKGSTFISALYGNQNTISHATAIDNWSQSGGPFAEFQKNSEQNIPDSKYFLLANDCFSIEVKKIPSPVNIYFYDGDYTEPAQELAFTHYNDAFEDVFIAVVDDWNFPEVSKGTYNAFKKLNYKILFEQVLPADFNGDTANWWNGLYVAVIQKNGKTKAISNLCDLK